MRCWTTGWASSCLDTPILWGSRLREAPSDEKLGTTLRPSTRRMREKILVRAVESQVLRCKLQFWNKSKILFD